MNNQNEEEKQDIPKSEADLNPYNSEDIDSVKDKSSSDQKQGFGSRLLSDAVKANNLINNYKQNGLGGLAKNAISNKVNEKLDATKDKAKAGIKNAAGKMVPESVKQKQQQLQAKKQAIQNKVNAPKKKLEEGKAKLNEMAFKKGVKAAANAAAPGAGEVAEKMLDTSKGKPAVEAARAASNPLSAIKDGTKKLIEIIISEKLKKKLLLYLVPSLMVGVTIIILLLLITGKFGDSQSYFKGNALTGENVGIAEVDEKYKKFYENVEKHGGFNKAMVIAVLTAYKDNDIYTNKNDNELGAECTQTEIDNNQCVAEYDSVGVATYSKSKMKKYIKKVASKIEESGGDVSEGKYDSPSSTGSKFFQWLYSDFIAEDYYEEYFKNISIESERAKLKEEIIHFIYLYYEDLKGASSDSIISNLCPNGITVTGEGTMNLDDYVAGVVAHEAYQDGGIEALKAQAIAARTYALNYTNGCTKPIENSTNAQTFHNIEYVKSEAPLSLKAAQETSGMVLTYNGKYFSAQYDSFCYDDSDCPDAIKNSDGTYSVTYKKLPNGETHKITLSDPSQYDRVTHAQGHAHGMSQLVSYQMAKQGKTYSEILKFFYSDGVQITQMGLGVANGIQLGTRGIYSTSILPFNTPLSNLTVSGGFYYLGGKYHGSLDIACASDKRETCTKIPIVAAHSGTITLLQNDRSRYYCSNTIYSNKDTTLTKVPGCNGMAMIIKVTDDSDPYKGYTFSYWHFDAISPDLKVGDKVNIGQFLGYMGSTGNSTGWHLHFKIANASGQDVNQDINITEFCARTGMSCSFGDVSNNMPQQ